MKISHEVPLSLLKESLSFNDFDYALVHLFESNNDYFEFFKNSLQSGREVYLDNSVFELGYPFDHDKCIYWINKLKPSYFIIPDRFCDAEFTIKKVYEWSPILKKMNTPSIGVIQGNSFEEFERAYVEIEPHVDMVAISFAQPFFEKLLPHMHKDEARTYGRYLLISYLEKSTLNKKKKHHLLGISLPQELSFYKGKHYINSVDSSSPIIHGYLNKRYTKEGLVKKDHLKMVDIFLDPIEMNDAILFNINQFKKFTL